MTKIKPIEIVVGLFMCLAVLAFAMLAFKVSGFNFYTPQKTFNVTANFENIGGLKIRSAVTIAGVKIGEVANIELDPKTFKAKVTMRLQTKETRLPEDSSASIFTEGLLGSNYVALTPGFDDEENKFLSNGGEIFETHSALVLENLVGQLLFNINQKDPDEKQ